MGNDDLRQCLTRGVEVVRERERSAAVVVALAPDGKGSYDIVLEVRASSLEQQPGEVCCPGGHVEPGETPAQAAVRETCEEFLMHPEQVKLVEELGVVSGPGGLPLHTFVGILDGYDGTFSRDEVASVFRLPLDWVLTHDPAVYTVRYDPQVPADFPWDLVEGGRTYHWRSLTEDIPFYDTEPVTWGATARVLRLFSQTMREGGWQARP